MGAAGAVVLSRAGPAVPAEGQLEPRVPTGGAHHSWSVVTSPPGTHRRFP